MLCLVSRQHLWKKNVELRDTMVTYIHICMYIPTKEYNNTFIFKFNLRMLLHCVLLVYCVPLYDL